MRLFGGRKRREAIWKQVAAELGGTHRRQTRWWRSDERIDAVVGGVPVVLDCYVVSTGKSAQVYTRVAATYVQGPGPKVKVAKQGFFSSIGKVMGMEDIALGHAAFDARFIVKADSVAVARRLWSAHAMQQLLADPLRGVWINSGPAKVEAVITGRWSDAAGMRAAFALVGELAARDLYGIAALRAIDGATVMQLHADDRPRAVLDTGLRVTIQAEDRPDRLVMAARASEQLDVEPIVVEVRGGKLVDADRASKLTQAAHVHLHAARSGTLTIDRAWQYFVWTDLELDPVRLRAGADLRGAIANAARGGVYR